MEKLQIIRFKHFGCSDPETEFTKACFARKYRLCKLLIDRYCIKISTNIFISLCAGANLELIILANQKFQPEIYSDALGIACREGRLDVAKWLYLEMQPAADYVRLFITACYSTKIDIARWILFIKPEIRDAVDFIPILINACSYGDVDILKFIFEVKPDTDIRYCDDFGFKYVCLHKHIDAVMWMCNKFPFYNFQIRRGQILPIIFRPYKIELFAGSIQAEFLYSLDCAICLEHSSDITSDCKHCFHKECLEEWRKRSSNCPICKQAMEKIYNIIEN